MANARLGLVEAAASALPAPTMTVVQPKVLGHVTAASARCRANWSLSCGGAC